MIINIANLNKVALFKKLFTGMDTKAAGYSKTATELAVFLAKATTVEIDTHSFDNSVCTEDSFVKCVEEQCKEDAAPKAAIVAAGETKTAADTTVGVERKTAADKIDVTGINKRALFGKLHAYVNLNAPLKKGIPLRQIDQVFYKDLHPLLNDPTTVEVDARPFNNIFGKDIFEEHVEQQRREERSTSKTTEAQRLLVIEFLNEVHDPYGKFRAKFRQGSPKKCDDDCYKWKEGGVLEFYEGSFCRSEKMNNAIRFSVVGSHSSHTHFYTFLKANAKTLNYERVIFEIKFLATNFERAKMAGLTEELAESFKSKLQDGSGCYVIADQDFLLKLHTVAEAYFKRKLKQHNSAAATPVTVSAGSAGSGSSAGGSVGATETKIQHEADAVDAVEEGSKEKDLHNQLYGKPATSPEEQREKILTAFKEHLAQQTAVAQAGAGAATAGPKKT